MECREKYWICSSNFKWEDGVHVKNSSMQAVKDIIRNSGISRIWGKSTVLYPSTLLL